MTWYVYELPPIDHNWEHLETVEKIARNLGERVAAQRCMAPWLDEKPDELDEFISDWANAKSAAEQVGYYDKPRVDPVVFWIPRGDTFRPGFVLKQDANGTTYVVSPVPLFHLEHDGKATVIND